MSAGQELLNLARAESENQTLFDELAGLVPAERLAEYYRVIAHTRTLSPNDEVLRVLEAMGILALLTRETPAAIAVERKSLQKILENALSKADQVEKRLAAYTSRLESRIAQLPKKLETALDPADANAGSSCAASRSATERKASLRRSRSSAQQVYAYCVGSYASCVTDGWMLWRTRSGVARLQQRLWYLPRKAPISSIE
jgi:hypothetical protein